MKKSNQNVFTLGLDGLDITINTDVKLEQNHYAFKNQAGKELGNLVAVKNGYKLHLCLPKMIRNNNSIPFGVSDYKQLKNVLEFIKNNVLNLFKGKSTKITIQACEVNSTVVLSRKEQTAPMLKLLSHVLLIKDEKLFIACSGEQIGKRYKAVKNLCSGQRIESIKTGQLSNSRFCFKIYDKAIEQNITDKGLLRIEFCYSVRGLKYAKVGRTLETFLTPDSINALLICYRKDYKTYFIDRYWNNKDSKTMIRDTYSQPIYEEMITIVYNDLCEHNGQPLTVAIMNKELVEVDFKLFKKACERYYSNKDSARKACYRVKQSKEIQINTGVIDEFVAFSKSIIYG